MAHYNGKNGAHFVFFDSYGDLFLITVNGGCSVLRDKDYFSFYFCAADFRYHHFAGSAPNLLICVKSLSPCV